MLSKVFVIDASERAALAVIRSLGAKGIEVTAGEDAKINAGFLSRYCKRKIVYPSPRKDYRKFLKYLLNFVKKEKFDLLIPVTDFTCIPLSKHKEEFEPYVRVAVPPYETMLKTWDKALTVKIAAECGVPYPKTVFVESIENVQTIAKDIEYPVVIKPRSKVIWANSSPTMMKVTQINYAYDAEDLVTKYAKVTLRNRELVRSGQLPIIQEYVPGVGFGVEALCNNSELLAIFMHKRLREYPISGGASTLRVSVKDEKLVKLAIKILKSINWQGVAMVEFRVDERNGEPKLLEVNGRFWGSLALAIYCGVDFPYLLYKMMLDRHVVRQDDYRVGAEMRWLLPGDLLWLLSSLMSGKQKIRVATEFLKAFDKGDDIISGNDPLPTLGAIVTSVIYAFDVLKGSRNIYGEVF